MHEATGQVMPAQVIGRGVIPNMPEAEYHAHPALSSTGARLLLDAPVKFKYRQDHPQPAKAAFDLGSAAHTKVLGIGANTVVYPDEHLTAGGNVSTKAATVEWARQQRADGLIPITEADARRVDAMAEAVLADPDARAVLEGIAGREVSIITEVDGVPMRARFDIYDGAHGADLKTARDSSPNGFNRAVGSHGYHVQQRWYEEAHLAATGRELEWFKFIVVDVAPPHVVGVYDLDFMWRENAIGKTARARVTYRECLARDVWPGYGAMTLTAPTWAVYEDEDEEVQF